MVILLTNTEISLQAKKESMAVLTKRQPKPEDPYIAIDNLVTPKLQLILMTIGYYVGSKLFSLRIAT